MTMTKFSTYKWLFATLLLFAGLLFSACSDSTTSNRPEEQPTIGFRGLAQKTRALETNQTNIADFRVWAPWARNASANDYEPAFMEGLRVERQTGDVWAYSPVRYWPTLGTVDFFAYSPANSQGVHDFALQGSVYDNVKLSYDVTTDPLLQEDFLVASALDESSSPVVMDFRHMLSQIEFRVRSTAIGVTFRVRQIQLHNLDRAGELTGIVPTPGATEVDWSWSMNTAAAEKNATYDIYLPQSVEASYPAGASSLPPFVSLTDTQVGNLMILPQVATIGTGELYTQADINADPNDGITQGLLNRPKDLGQNFYISVRLDSETIYYPGTGIIPFHDNVTLYIPLYVSLGADGTVGGGDDTPFEFEAGSKYTFMLELNDLDQVVFTVDETDWSTFVPVPIA